MMRPFGAQIKMICTRRPQEMLRSFGAQLEALCRPLVEPGSKNPFRLHPEAVRRQGPDTAPKHVKVSRIGGLQEQLEANRIG